MEFETDVVQYVAIKNQAPDTLSGLKTTRNDQMPINNKIPVRSITFFSPEKREARVVYMANYDVINVRECIQLPKIYEIATVTESGHNELPITPHGFIYEQSYCKQHDPQLDYRD